MSGPSSEKHDEPAYGDAAARHPGPDAAHRPGRPWALLVLALFGFRRVQGLAGE